MAKVVPDIDVTREDLNNSTIADQTQQHKVIDAIKNSDTKAEGLKERTLNRLKIQLKINDTICAWIALTSCFVAWFAVVTT